MLLVAGLLIFNIANAENRIIIKYKPTTNQINQYTSGTLKMSSLTLQMMKPLSGSVVNELAQNTGYKNLKEIGVVGTGAHVLDLGKNLSDSDMDGVLAKLRAQSNVDYVEVDKLLQPTSLPQFNPVQWDMLESSNLVEYGMSYGGNFIGALNYWNSLYPTTNIGNEIVVAVIDTGYTPHSKIINNLIPYNGTCTSVNGVGGCYGYSFISDCRIAGTCANTTSNGSASISPQPDGLDLGDYISIMMLIKISFLIVRL